MKSLVICSVLLALLYGNVHAGIAIKGKAKATNEGAKVFPKPGKPAANKTSHSGRIINGSNGSNDYFPYIVHLTVHNDDGSSSGCGATIITYMHAFTAAHCVYNKDDALVTLYGGSASRSSGGIEFEVTSIEIHPNYNPNTIQYDAAVLEVAETFEGYDNIVPIELQDQEVPAGTWCYAAGWGVNNWATQSSPDIVQYEYFQALSPAKCSSTYPGHDSIFCIHRGMGIALCLGDSGGPVVCNGKLTGALSFGMPGCKSEYPAAFTKVMAPSIREFISMYVYV